MACLRFLFPNGSPPRFTRYESSADVAWLVLAHSRAPRLLVPTTPPRATSLAIDRVSSALDWQHLLGRQMVGHALRTGVGSLYPERLVLDREGADSFLGYLSERFGQPVIVAISVGRPRANLKPVLTVFSHTGQRLAFVKVGYPSVAAVHVERETAALRALADKTFTQLVAPGVIFADTWHGAPVLAITALTEGVRWVRDGRRRIPHAAMAEVSRSSGAPISILDDVPAWVRLRDQADVESRRDDFGEAVAVLRERHGDLVLRPSAWHGDWTPWNMCWERNKISLWDWERYDPDTVPGLDAYHYAISCKANQGGLNKATVRKGLDWAVSGTTSVNDRAKVLGQLYLAFIAGRHLEGRGDFSAGSFRLAGILLDVLSESLAEPVTT